MSEQIPTGPWDNAWHLVSQEDLTQAWVTDPSLQDFAGRIAVAEAKEADFEQREAAARIEVDRLKTELAELESKVRAVTRQKQQKLGEVASHVYTQKLMRDRVKEFEKKISQRRVHVWKTEANRSLRTIGKGIRFNTGRKARVVNEENNLK